MKKNRENLMFVMIILVLLAIACGSPRGSGYGKISSSTSISKP